MNEESYRLPEGWTWATVQDVVLGTQSGFASGKKNVQGGIKHLRMNNISEGCTLDLSSVTTVPKDLARPAHILKPGDILFCHTNSMKLVGKTALFDRVDGPYAFSNHLTRLRVPIDGPPPEWLWFWLATLWRQRYFETRCKQWVNQATVERGTLLSAPIPVAPLREQRRIVAHVTKMIARNRIARNRLQKLPGIIKQFRQSVLAKAFRGELTERDANDEPVEKLLERIKRERRKRWEEELRARGRDPKKYKYRESKSFDAKTLPTLPNYWAWSSIRDIAEDSQHALKAGPFGSSLRKQFYVSKGYKIYGQEQVIRGDPFYGNYYIDEKRYENLKSCSVKSGDILISLVGTIGRVLVLPDGIEPGIINPRLVKISPDKRVVNAEYIKHYLDSPNVNSYYSLVSHGGTMDILNLAILEELPIPLSPLGEQQRIVSTIAQLLAKSKEVERSAEETDKRIDKLEQSILAKAFRGILVPHDDNDEPASVLLERIRAQRATVTKGGKYRLEEFASSAPVAPKA